MSIFEIRSVSEDVFLAAVSMEVNESMELVPMGVLQFSTELFQRYNFRIGNFVFGMKRTIEIVPQVV